MCGISGFVNRSLTVEDLQLLQRTINHRGPDASGFFFEKGVGLAHNRLSIIDLSESANQPFLFEHLVLIYNGECYNFREVRTKLIAIGYTFETESDTEVLIKGFHAWGIKVIDQMIGMFAFAIYDKRSEALYLVRDRLGVKPLYYDFDGENILFASELKTFHNTGNTKGIDNVGLGEFLAFGYTVGNNTLFKSIKKIPPGHYLKFSKGSIELIKYWDACDFVLEPKTQLTEKQLVDQLEELLISSFSYRMVSDVPVGIFLSGGVDSTTLVALLSKHFGKVNTFTIGFEDHAFNEAPFAKEIATYFGTNHTERILSLREAKEELNAFYNIYDEPFYDSSGIPTALVTKVAKENNMKVVLSSEGGDELFGGYPSYQRAEKIGNSVFSLPKPLRKMGGTIFQTVGNSLPVGQLGNKFSKLGQLLKSGTWLDFYSNSVSSAPQQTVLDSVTGSIPFHFDISPEIVEKIHPIELFMLWDLKYLMPNDYLMKIDRATMHYGVEAREPFLDHRLVQFALQLPLEYKLREGHTKYLLKKVLERYIPSKFFERPKMGFSIPLFSWFKTDLHTLFDTRLQPHEFKNQWPQIDYSWVRHELELFNHSRKINKEINLITLWKFLNLMLWTDKYQIGK